QDIVVRQAVQHRVVDRQAQHVAEWAAAERRGVVPIAGFGAAFLDPAAGVVFEVYQVDTDCGDTAQLGEQLADELAGHRHPADFPHRRSALWSASARPSTSPSATWPTSGWPTCPSARRPRDSWRRLDACVGRGTRR